MDQVPCPGCHEGMEFGQELCPKCRDKALQEAKKGPPPPPRIRSGGCLVPILFLIVMTAMCWVQRKHIKAFINGLKGEAKQAEKQYGGKTETPAQGSEPAP